MNLVQFIENRYQELTLESKNAFSVTKDAEIKASHQILTSYRTFLKWALIPKVIFNFIQVKLGLRDEPEAVLLNQMIAEKKAKEDAEKFLKGSNVSSLHPEVQTLPSSPA